MKIKIALVSLIFVPFVIFAQNETALPNAGLTPESPFYFLDTLSEALQEFFTFNPEGKARLQVTFAAERAAEIKVILETKGVEAKGLEVARSRLQTHLTNAASIVTAQKSEGKDVSALARELDDTLETPKSALVQTFKDQKQALEAREDALKAQLKAAHRAGDTTKEEALAEELGKVKTQKELLELKKEGIEDELEAEEEKLEEEMEVQEKAGKAIREAEEKKQEVLAEAQKEGVEIPSTAFAKFDRLIGQAKELFAKENYQGARQLAKQAKEALEDVDKETEKLEKEKEQKEEQAKEEEEQKQEQEEKQREEAKERNNENEER